jgi:hypothetical protein
MMLVLLLLLARPVFASNEADGILGVPWGATQEVLRAALQQAGNTVRCDAPQICKLARASFGPVPVNITYLFPEDGKFEMAILRFDPADYKKLVAVFVDRYGDPASARREQIHLSGCAAETITILEWWGERVVMDLRQFESKNEGRAMIMLKALRDREAADSRPEKKDDPHRNP